MINDHFLHFWQEMGGYFIINGIEKVIRMMIMPRRNFPLAMIKPKWKSKGPGYTQYGNLWLTNCLCSHHFTISLVEARYFGYIVFYNFVSDVIWSVMFYDISKSELWESLCCKYCIVLASVIYIAFPNYVFFTKSIIHRFWLSCEKTQKIVPKV